MPDLISIPPDYISKTDAIVASNRSKKRFEDAVKKAGIEPLWVPNRGKGPTPYYKQSDIEKIKRTQQVGLTVSSPQAVVGQTTIPRPKPKPSPVPFGPALTVSVDRMHLVTMKQAHELGYPYPLLKEWKNEEHPPGIRYGKRSFRFSVPALMKRAANYE